MKSLLRCEQACRLVAVLSVGVAAALLAAGCAGYAGQPPLAAVGTSTLQPERSSLATPVGALTPVSQGQSSLATPGITATPVAQGVSSLATPIAADAAAVEQHFGIRVTLLAATAGGGLIDLRCRVTDPAKAMTMLQPANLPVLVAEERGITLTLNMSAPPSQPAGLKAGQILFFLYPNTRVAITPGSHVTVIFDDLRIEHVPAQ